MSDTELLDSIVEVSSAVGKLTEQWPTSDQLVGVVVSPNFGEHPPLSVDVFVSGSIAQLPKALRAKIGESVTITMASEYIKLPVRLTEFASPGISHRG